MYQLRCAVANSANENAFRAEDYDTNTATAWILKLYNKSQIHIWLSIH